MGDFNDAGACRERVDQGVRLGLVGGIEIGILFVEQIDFRIGRIDDLFERFELPLARREAELLVHQFGDHDRLAFIVLLDVDRHHAAGELEREPVGRRPIIGALLHFGLEARQQRGSCRRHCRRAR